MSRGVRPGMAFPQGASLQSPSRAFKRRGLSQIADSRPSQPGFGEARR